MKDSLKVLKHELFRIFYLGKGKEDNIYDRSHSRRTKGENDDLIFLKKEGFYMYQKSKLKADLCSFPDGGEV